MATPFQNNPAFLQAMMANALKNARRKEQQNQLNQTVTQYLANLMAEQRDLAECLIRCGFNTPLMIYAFLQEGFSGLAKLRNLTSSNLTVMATRISQKPPDAGPTTIGLVLLKNVEALIYWVKTYTTMGLPLDATLVNKAALAESMLKLSSATERKNAENKIATESNPGKLEIDNLKWVRWNAS